MRFDIVTLFPGMFVGPFDGSVLRRAIDRGLLAIDIHNIRDFATGRHKVADDYPYGGGAGMVMKPEPIFAAVESVRAAARDQHGVQQSDVILMTPQGRRFTQKIAEDFARREHLILLCGHYEGVDERAQAHLVDDEISIGDYVLTGGELPAMVILDAVARLIPGVLGAEESLVEESISSGLLEYPQYTRPADFRGWDVPEVLLSGDHGRIARWRRQESLRRTYLRRPDLLARSVLSREDWAYLASLVQPKV